MKVLMWGLGGGVHNTNADDKKMRNAYKIFGGEPEAET
jgi:hypothetical protein